MSADIAWLLTRNTASYLVKRKGNENVQFSREKGNLLNKNSFKYSSVNPKAVFVSAAAKGVKIGVKRGAASKQLIQTKTVTHGGRRVVSASIKKMVQNYRPDLVKAALARGSRILDTKDQKKKRFPKLLRKKTVKA
ncbi:60S ribosomal protein L28 [Entophlyctis luteolus]|nr:60S ribosomal protein L28 [Entophlyctis luteolus]KAJ3350794.1 60S ribosomal protein L28 [Entophlyctis luteolus]KAJ3385536.1 60S ribosomal protein L28 [Entophlyctis sp. JEL0112]